jgi:hypothetical protein
MGKHQVALTPPALVGGLFAEHTVVPRARYLVLATGTQVAMTALPPLRYITDIQIKGHRWVSPESGHNSLPLGPVRSYPPAAVKLVYDIVGDLVRYGIAQIFLEVLAKYPGVVAYAVRPAYDLEHTGGTAGQVKQDRNRLERAIKQ